MSPGIAATARSPAVPRLTCPPTSATGCPTPAESKNEWDLYKILRTIPAEESYRPLSESKCKLVNN